MKHTFLFYANSIVCLFNMAFVPVIAFKARIGCMPVGFAVFFAIMGILTAIVTGVAACRYEKIKKYKGGI